MEGVTDLLVRRLYLGLNEAAVLVTMTGAVSISVISSEDVDETSSANIVWVSDARCLTSESLISSSKISDSPSPESDSEE